MEGSGIYWKFCPDRTPYGVLLSVIPFFVYVVFWLAWSVLPGVGFGVEFSGFLSFNDTKRYHLDIRSTIPRLNLLFSPSFLVVFETPS